MNRVIEIPKRATVCSHGQEALEPGMDIHSILKEGEKEGVYVRHDYCTSCWHQHVKQSAAEMGQGSWKSKVPAKKKGSDLPKQRGEMALVLLKEALLQNEAKDAAKAFILALYLSRKRLIYLRQEIVLENGQPASLYEAAQTEEMFCVKKYPLAELPISEVQSELAAKFKTAI